MEESYKVAKKLTNKSGSGGKAQFLVPTTDQMATILTSSEDFISALNSFFEFAKQKESKFPRLKTIPLTQANLDKLKTDLNKVKNLPY